MRASDSADSALTMPISRMMQGDLIGSTAAGVHDTDIRMNPIKLAGLALVILGGLGLAYGSFAYTKDTHDLKLGPLELSVKEKETVNVPVWAGVVAIVLGGLMLFGGRKS